MGNAVLEKVYIGIEDLAANALIAMLDEARTKNEEQKRFVAFSRILKLGTIMVDRFKEAGEDAVLIYSREANERMFTDYSRFFEFRTEDGEEGVYLKDGIEVDDLWVFFRSTITMRMMEVFDAAMREWLDAA